MMLEKISALAEWPRIVEIAEKLRRNEGGDENEGGSEGLHMAHL